MGFDKLKQFWVYLKQGKNEVNFITSLFNFLMLLSIRYELELSGATWVSLVIGMIMIYFIIGKIMVKQVNPTNPYTQDNLQSAIALQESLVYFYKGDSENAINSMNIAIALRNKWVKEV